MNIATLKDLLVYVIQGGGAGAIAYYLISQTDKAGWYAKWTSDWVRYMSLAVAAILAVLAGLAGIGLGYWPVPVGVTAWVEYLFSVIAPAVMLSQGLHAAFKLKGQKRGVAAKCCPK